MARSFATAKLLSALVFDNISLALTRRGYAASAAAASQGVVSNVGRGASGRIGKAAQDEMRPSAENSWVPDPITGYYRPENGADEIDVAELREMLLKKKH